jgi:hypothetical protein
MTDDLKNKQQPNPSIDDIKDEGETLEWTFHKAKQNWWITAGVTILIFVLAVLVYSATDSRTFTVLALLLLFMSLSRFYLPITYRLTDRRIMIKTMTQTTYKEWSQYRTCYPDKNGILLSPFIQPTRLENFRGIFLLFNNNKAQVTDFVQRHLNKEIESSSEKKSEGKS